MFTQKPFQSPTWSEVYHSLRHAAEAHRGLATSADGEHPETTVGDGFQLAKVFDKAIYDHLAAPFVDRWTAMSERLVSEPNDDQLYTANASLWSMLSAAALELDHAGAPPADAHVVHDALASLEAKDVDPDAALRNADPGIQAVFREPTWRSMALRQLGFFRRLCGEIPGVHSMAPRVPATSNAEVLTLARYWQQQVALHGGLAASAPHKTYHQVVYSWWAEAVRAVLRDAPRGVATDVYENNSSFWFGLLMLSTQSRHCDDLPMPWSFRLGTRNASDAAVPNKEDATGLSFPSAPTWDDAARMQRDRFAAVRGFDLVDNQLVSRVPRTTVDEVRQLAAYWTIGLARVGLHHEQDISYQTVVSRWKTETERVWALPLSTPPTQVYEHNADFWGALMTAAIQVGVTTEAPPAWKIQAENLERLKAKTIDGLKSMAEAAFDGPGFVLGLPGKLWDAVLGKGAEAATRAVARPLLYVGGAALGLTIAWVMLRKGH